MSERAVLLERLEALERELAALRRDAAAPEAPLPTEPFDALEVRTRDLACLVPVARVREVLAMVWPEPLAEAPEWVMGTFSDGERVLPLVDLGGRLHGEPTPLSVDLRVVVLEGGEPVGLVVDATVGLVRVAPSDLRAPAGGSAFVTGHVLRPDGTALHLLDLARVARGIPAA